MAISLKHSFFSPKTDEPDPTIVRPSNWNAEHALTMDTNKLLGRGTAGPGTAEEITLGPTMSMTGTTLDALPSSFIPDGDKGDITVSGSGTTWTIDPNAVTYAKLQNASPSVLLGRGSSGGGVPQEITLGTNLSMAGTTLSATLGGGAVAYSVPQGRLTLQTGSPVMTTTQSAKTTIFYSPYVGNQVVLYDGSSLMVPTTFAELSNVTTASSVGSAGPAAVAASSVYDLFVWSNAGTVTLTRGPAWTNDTTRSAGTALVMVSGILTNAVAITNGPAISRGTYVGSVRSNAASQIDWIYGGSGAGGVRGIHYVWNMYNRRTVRSSVNDTTATVAYSTAAWAQYLGGVNNSVDFVSGQAEDNWLAICAAYGFTSSGAAAIGIGLDVTNALAGGFTGQIGAGSQMVGMYSANSLGKHTVNFIYFGGSGATFYGNSAPARDGLIFEFSM